MLLEGSRQHTQLCRAVRQAGGLLDAPEATDANTTKVVGRDSPARSFLGPSCLVHYAIALLSPKQLIFLAALSNNLLMQPPHDPSVQPLKRPPHERCYAQRRADTSEYAPGEGSEDEARHRRDCAAVVAGTTRTTLTHPAALGLLAYLNETLYAAEDTARGLAQTLANDGIYAITDFADLAARFEQNIRGHHHVSDRATRLPPVFASFRDTTEPAASSDP